MSWLTLSQWSPYVAGLGIGILSWVSFLLSDRPLGCSTAFARVSGILELRLRGKKTLEKPYFRKVIPEMNWDIALIIGIVLGSFISAMLSGSFKFQWVPTLWAQAFGSSTLLRLAGDAGWRGDSGYRFAMGWGVHQRAWNQRDIAIDDQ